MTPRQIAAALDDAPIEGLEHHYGQDVDEGYLRLCVIDAVLPNADAALYHNADDLSGVLVFAGRLGVREFWVRRETLRADLVGILAWALNANHPDPAAPETRDALRSPGLYAEILRRHLTDRRDALAVLGDRYALLIAAIDAALKETS